MYRIFTFVLLIMLADKFTFSDEYPHSFFHLSQQEENNIETYYIFFWANTEATKGTILKATRIDSEEWILRGGKLNVNCVEKSVDEFSIHWNTGEKEVGRYECGKYKILSHSSDESAVGNTLKWEHRTVPPDLKLKIKFWLSINEIKPLPEAKIRKRKSYQIWRLRNQRK